MMHRFVVSGVLLLSLLAAGADQSLALADRTIEGSVPASALRSLEVRGNVGSITVRPGSGPDVRYSVRLTAKTEWHFFGSRTGRPDLLELKPLTHGDALVLDLSGDRRNVEEEWEIEVPERFSANLRMDVGKIRLNGIRGGCEARVDVGNIDLRVPEGSVKAENDVGDIYIESQTPSHGNVDLRSDVGKVRFSLDGQSIDHKRDPGAGDAFRSTAPGRDRIHAHTDVGGVQVRVR